MTQGRDLTHFQARGRFNGEIMSLVDSVVKIAATVLQSAWKGHRARELAQSQRLFWHLGSIRGGAARGYVPSGVVTTVPSSTALSLTNAAQRQGTALSIPAVTVCGAVFPPPLKLWFVSPILRFQRWSSLPERFKRHSLRVSLKAGSSVDAGFRSRIALEVLHTLLSTSRPRRSRRGDHLALAHRVVILAARIRDLSSRERATAGPAAAGVVSLVEPGWYGLELLGARTVTQPWSQYHVPPGYHDVSSTMIHGAVAKAAALIPIAVVPRKFVSPAVSRFLAGEVWLVIEDVVALSWQQLWAWNSHRSLTRYQIAKRLARRRTLAAAAVQRVWAGHLCRREFNVLRHRWLFEAQERETTNSERCAAIRLQCAVRRRACALTLRRLALDKASKRDNHAASLVQCSWQGHLDRRRVRRAITKRRGLALAMLSRFFKLPWAVRVRGALHTIVRDKNEADLAKILQRAVRQRQARHAVGRLILERYDSRRNDAAYKIQSFVRGQRRVTKIKEKAGGAGVRRHR